jgi:hypothetical protein
LHACFFTEPVKLPEEVTLGDFVCRMDKISTECCRYKIPPWVYKPELCSLMAILGVISGEIRPFIMKVTLEDILLFFWPKISFKSLNITCKWRFKGRKF